MGGGGVPRSHQSERCSSSSRGCLCHCDGSSLSVCFLPTTPLQHITDVHTTAHSQMQRRERTTHTIHVCKSSSTHTHIRSFLHADSKTLKFIHKHRVSDSKICLVRTLTPAKVLYCMLTFSVSVLPIFHSRVLSLKPK